LINPHIHIEGLTKSYGNEKALKALSVDIAKGELFGFIGPDGAGKTTLFRLLATLLLPDSGSAEVLGYDTVSGYKEIRKQIGYMPGKFSLYQDLSVEENLNFFAGIHGTTLQENYHLVQDIYQHIEPFKNRRAGKLSGGMKQKLALSCALIHQPKVLLLDEPTTGVDAVSRQEFWEMLKNLKEKGITVVVSTPYMDEAALCDRVALMQKGSVLKINTPQQITAEFGHALFSIRSDTMFKLLGDLLQLENTHAAFRFGDTIHFTSHNKEETSQSIANNLIAQGHHNVVVEPVLPTIEDCFILLMKMENNA
jgi:ABC-type multidrug transport system ATPase subunit